MILASQLSDTERSEQSLRFFVLVNVSVGQIEQKFMPCAVQHIKISLNCCSSRHLFVSSDT